MKKLHTLFLTLFFLPLVSFSQDFWEKINIPSGYTFSSVAVGDDGTIYLGSHKKNGTGWVFISENNGETWDSLSLANRSIYSLALNQEGNLLVGTNTRIYLYDFIEQSWSTRHISLTNYNFISLTLGPSNSFFAGSNTFNRSYDDGYTWEELLNMEQDFIYSIIAKSIDTIYIGTTNFLGGGGVFRSVDGGDTWQNIGMENHFIASLGMNNMGDLFAGGIGEYYYGVGGLYRLPTGSNAWDTLSYWPRIRAIIITEEDFIYCGYWSTDENNGGVMHSMDSGETWTVDTAGMGDVGISKLVLGKNETLYALSSTFPPSKLFMSVLPVSVNHTVSPVKRYDSFCFPNPFSTTTTLQFNLKITDAFAVEIKIYDQVGKEVQHIPVKSAIEGMNTVEFNMHGLSPGIYFYSLLINGNIADSKKMVMAR